MSQKTEDADRGGSRSEQGFGHPRLKRNQRRLVDVAPRQAAAAYEEVHLVAEVSVPEVNAPQRSGDVNNEDEAGKRGSQHQRGAERSSRQRRRRGLQHVPWLLVVCLVDSIA